MPPSCRPLVGAEAHEDLYEASGPLYAAVSHGRPLEPQDTTALKTRYPPSHEYLLGPRSGIEWVMERHQVKTDQASGLIRVPTVSVEKVETGPCPETPSSCSRCRSGTAHIPGVAAYAAVRG